MSREWSGTKKLKTPRSAVIRPVSDVMSLLGIAGNGKTRDLKEMEKARKAIAGDAE